MTDAAATYSASLIDRAHGSLIGGLIGDAMGTPSEGLEPEEIDAGFGIEDFQGDGTDDSIMKYLLADALIATDGNADANSWATQWLAQRSKIGGAMSDRFFASILHAAAKLSCGVLPRRVALGHMPSSTAAMSIAPVGIVNAATPVPRPRRPRRSPALFMSMRPGSARTGPSPSSPALPSPCPGRPPSTR